jgi:hypothetical protein
VAASQAKRSKGGGGVGALVTKAVDLGPKKREFLVNVCGLTCHDNKYFLQDEVVASAGAGLSGGMGARAVGCVGCGRACELGFCLFFVVRELVCWEAWEEGAFNFVSFGVCANRLDLPASLCVCISIIVI